MPFSITDQECNFQINFVKNIKDSIHGYIGLSPLEILIIDSPIFQRLRGISQVPFGYMVYPSHSVKRFEHSIGTMHLAGKVIEAVLNNAQSDLKNEYLIVFVKDIKTALAHYGDKEIVQEFLNKTAIAPAFDSDTSIETLLKEREFSDALKNIVIQLSRIMGLLHDVGHLPFSHLGEEIVAVIMNNVNDLKKDEIISKIVPLYSYLKDNPPFKVGKKSQILENPIHELNTYHIATKLLEEYVELTQQDVCKKAKLKFFSCLLRKSLNKIEIGKYKSFRALLGIIDNDIDVDRADYFLRDGITSGIGFGYFDLERIINSMKLFKTKNDFLIRPDTSSISAVETFVTERSKLHRWLYFHPIVLLFETCFVYLIELLVNKYNDEEVIDLLGCPESYDVTYLRYFGPESDIINRLKKRYLAILKKDSLNITDNLYITLYNVIYLKNKSCRPLWQKEGEFYGTFQSQIVKTAQEQKVRNSTSDDIHEYIHKFFRDLAEDLEKSNDLVVNLEQELTSGDKYHIFVTVKKFKPIKTLPIDITCEPWQYVILSKDGNFIGIEEYPAIKAIEKTWYKQIPMNIYILSKDGKEISRPERDETRKQVEEFFFSNEHKSKFSFKEFVKSI